MSGYDYLRPKNLVESSRPRGMAGKVAQVEEYILAEARRLQCTPDEVDCPSQEWWDRLAAGQTPALPPRTVLSLYADDDMHLAAQLDPAGYPGAYFAAAQRNIRNIQEKRS